MSGSIDRDPHHEGRWRILGVIALAQLMVVLDVTIVTIALPSAQADLGFDPDSRQWVMTAYALAFGSLLLLGGKISDLIGRKWTFIAGLLGFAGASAVGGAASSFEVLVGARALQGAFAALLAPAALSIVTTTFTAPAERGKAFGIYGAIGGAGAAVELLLGGFLTELLTWRWTMYLNLGFAIPAAIAGGRLLVNMRPAERPRIDVPGWSQPRASSPWSTGSPTPRWTVGALRSPSACSGSESSPSRRSSQSSGGWPRRSCRSGWSATATGVRPFWPSRSRASRRSRRFCS